MRQACQAQLVEAGQELLLMLAAEQPEHPVAGDLRPLARGHHQLQPQQVLVVQLGLGGDGGKQAGHRGFLRHIVTAVPGRRRQLASRGADHGKMLA
jgi:hypothetical protein